MAEDVIISVLSVLIFFINGRFNLEIIDKHITKS